MITCPNCNHQNPEGAQQCEACYTPLPAMVACPNCGAPVQENASFCGQCGSDLRGAAGGSPPSTPEAVSTQAAGTMPESSIPTENFLNTGSSSAASSSSSSSGFDLPDLVTPDPLIVPDPITPEAAAPEATQPEATVPEATQPEAVQPESSSAPVVPPSAPPASPAATQLQVMTARLRHAQSDTAIEIPRQLSVVRIGKPNNQTPPDIDVSGFSDSDIVSRVHANLRVEGDVYYLEDIGSSNGTYVNGLPLAVGNRHRLRAGDRIALGKGDKVSFIFETV